MRHLRLYIARDEDGDLNLFHTKPRKVKGEKTKLRHFATPFYTGIPLSKTLFPEINFQNSPVYVKDLTFEMEI
jgi:hypothetical protein